MRMYNLHVYYLQCVCPIYMKRVGLRDLETWGLEWISLDNIKAADDFVLYGMVVSCHAAVVD